MAPFGPGAGRDEAGCRTKLGSTWEEPYKTGISGISDTINDRDHEPARRSLAEPVRR